MEVKIKYNIGYVDADWTIENGVMVVSPKEKFEPKDGDVVFSGSSLISIFKEMSSGTSFASYAALSNGELKKEFDFWSASNIRPATEKEKQKLFDKLAEKGYEFDFEKKELVKLKWKPKVGEKYYTIAGNTCSNNIFFVESYKWVDDSRDNKLYSKRIVFKTKEECQEFCNRLNQAIEGIKP